MNLKHLISCIILSFLLIAPSIAQEDSVQIDSIIKEPREPWLPQKKAGWMSAAVPGLGQIYNKKYWKLPILYGAGAGLVMGISYNHRNYKTFKEAYTLRTDNDTSTIDSQLQYSDGNLKIFRDYYRRNRDFLYILSGVLYFLNIVDAVVDAHLGQFDVSDDLSLRISPALIRSEKHTFAGATLSFSLK